ncbi:MAG: succinylglutamate desuccinylase/aspartoacylase family protein [Balneolales bacterium]|nr:succinylglutamate desuccinylase/aspartoacylase family protein [Balneolales bacterium]
MIVSDKNDFIIKGIAVEAGKSAQVSYKIARLPTHTPIELPVYVYRGEKPGPVLLLTAGLHGNEVNGIEIVRQLLANKLCIPDAGTVIAIPIVNIYGFLQSARYLPDGKDLNRSFPGSKTGSLAQRVAHVLMKEIIPLIDYGIDFHTGGASLSNFPQIRCDFEYGINIKLAEIFAPPFVLNSSMIEKSFRKAAHKQGKHIIVYEGGESLRFDHYSISEGVKGTLRLMDAIQMKPYAEPVPHKCIRITSSSWLRAKYAGIFHSNVKEGEKIKKNQLLGSITDPYGETTYKLKAATSGYVLGLNHMPVLNAGDAIMHIGRSENKV